MNPISMASIDSDIYNIIDLNLSIKTTIPENSAIVFIINDNFKYFKFLKQAIYNLQQLHDVNIYILTFNCKEKIQKLLHDFDISKINILEIAFDAKDNDLEKDFLNLYTEFQYIKPFALKYLISFIRDSDIKCNNLLYLDADVFPLKNINQLFEVINNEFLVVKEFGVDYRVYGYDNYLNSIEIYNHISVLAENRYPRRKPVPNTGVLGFNINRDMQIIDQWYENTKIILQKNLKQYIKWWDQGVFILTLEQLGKNNIVSDNRKFNYTVLFENIQPYTLSTIDANIVHFIGDNKIDNLPLYTHSSATEKKYPIEIAVAGHSPDQFVTINPRSYLKFCMLSELNYDNITYASNSLGEARVFLANNIFDKNTQIVGTVTASWNNKYYPYKIDQIYNWPFQYIFNKILYDKSLVLCATLCTGAYSKNNDPLWSKNFQQHFRNVYPNSHWVQDMLYDTTGLVYDGLRPTPYANQIICHKDLYQELCFFVRKHIDKIIEHTSNITYGYDSKRSIAFILEELTMLWWASKTNVQFIPMVDIVPNWYK